MNPANREGWGPSQGPPPANGMGGSEQSQSQASRPLGAFGVGGSAQQPPQQPTQANGPVLPPPSGPFYSSSQSNPPPGHNLPGLSGLPQPTQSSPGQGASRPHSSSQDPAPAQAHQGASYSLPGISQTLHAQQHNQPQSSVDREREMREKEMLDRHQEEMRERELRERERQQQEQAAHENHAGSMQIHQPVAVGPQARSIHGPNGLLGNAGQISGPHAMPSTLGAPNAQGNIFNGVPVQQNDAAMRIQHHPLPPPPTQMMMPFSGPGPQPLNMNQGQQPILNDALSYLDQVKVQFVDHPDVYNRFLDIMKDFKSGAIDTPGVIERVSTLFAGNPNLIQGFNTFLPPGYKIECGTGDDPNAIRVTTPMGTTVSSMPVPRPLSNPRPPAPNGSGPAAGDRQFFENPPRSGAGSNWQQQQGGPGGPDAHFSPGTRPGGQPAFGAQAASGAQAPLSPEATHSREHPGTGPVSSAMSEQRVVSQLQNAAAASTGGLGRQVLSPPGPATTPLAGQAIHNMNANAQGLGGAGEKRGPVEFNHAISYVNKIKNRFASQPDIYKQFLEILQTYQRESKPIQDVYAQVTTLFSSAPDLLEDFKQFLPESAAQHRAAQAARQAAEESVMTSNIRGEPAYHGAPAPMQSTPRADQPKLPPLGNFAPTPSTNRDNKRKRGERIGTTASSTTIPTSVPPEMAANKPGFGQANNVNKRLKPNQPSKQAAASEGPTVEPTLIPALPEPLPPTTSATPTQDEIAFFDKVKKHIGNKNTMNEFLKLCNLFSQDLIDANLLVHRAHAFIGSNPELMGWLKSFMGYRENDKAELEARARVVNSRVALSNCRGLGPSYRLLPKRERMKPCSGRDELCRSVLNDEWASHPTWASEDSGFVAHRKNQFEEGLHRIEEERHDYDHNIEACLRTIQQLDPIAQSLLQMSPEDRASFVLPPGLGGQSETIYKRVIMKIYGREKGRAVIENLFSQPFNVIPILLNRMKQKLEEWKAAQREWEKVWREQTQKMFWKSLDHQSIGAKQADKRQFQLKTLQNEIQVKFEEQKRQRELQGLSPSTYQFVYAFEDTSVLQDATRLVLTYAEQSHPTDYPRLTAFMKEFVPLFFGLDAAHFDERVQTSAMSSPGNEDADEDSPSVEDGYSPRHKANQKRTNLLHSVLDKKRGKGSRKEMEDSIASGSRGSTPDVASAADEEMAGTVDSPNENGTNDDSGIERWLDHPVEGNVLNMRDVAANEPYRRVRYNMYCNLPIYCFFRMFVILYERLLNLKKMEDKVHETVRRAKLPKPAASLNMLDKLPTDFFGDTSPTANYYEQILHTFEEQIKGEVEMAQVEETLRRFYLAHGWQLYSIDRLLSALVRFALAIPNSDSKDKTWDIYQLFKKDRVRDETTHQDELNYRKLVEKYSKDGDVYRITFDAAQMKAYVQIFKKDEMTFDTSLLSPETRWRYYIASWTAIDPTEGVPSSEVNLPFVKNSFITFDETSEDNRSLYHQVKSTENLEIRVCVNTYRLVFNKDTEEWMVRPDSARTGGQDGQLEAEKELEERAHQAHVKLVMNNAWMKGLSKDDVDAKKEAFRRALEGETAATGAKEDERDEEMQDA